MIYTYDGSFYGLLSCIYAHYYEEKAVEIYAAEHFMGSLVDSHRMIVTDEEKAEKVETSIREKLSVNGYLAMYRTFLSNDPKKDCYILDYLIHGFKLGPRMDRLFSAPFVLPVREMSRKVSMEAHRFLGYLRFTERGDYLYGVIEPDHDILPLIAEHFADRMYREQIIIHDAKRKKAVVANKGRWMIEENLNDAQWELMPEAPVSEEEAMYRHLWQGYFEHIAIAGRKNLKLQQQFVPLKYRKHLVEMQA